MGLDSCLEFWNGLLWPRVDCHGPGRDDGLARLPVPGHTSACIRVAGGVVYALGGVSSNTVGADLLFPPSPFLNKTLQKKP